MGALYNVWELYHGKKIMGALYNCGALYNVWELYHAMKLMGTLYNLWELCIMCGRIMRKG